MSVIMWNWLGRGEFTFSIIGKKKSSYTFPLKREGYGRYGGGKGFITYDGVSGQNLRKITRNPETVRTNLEGERPDRRHISRRTNRGGSQRKGELGKKNDYRKGT